MCRILIIIPVKGREEVTNLCTGELVSHIQYASYSAIRARLKYVESLDDNETLGAKLNRALDECKEEPFDYLMVLGSDDLLRRQIWLYITTAIAERLQFFGFNECYVYDRINHRAKIWNYGPATIGAGRCISRKLVEQCGWELWDNAKSNGIDNSMDAMVMRKAGAYAHIIPTLYPVICDIKDGDNLNSYDMTPGAPVNAARVRE